MVTQVKNLDTYFILCLINIYAPLELRKKITCWKKISECLELHGNIPYIIIVDFNAIPNLTKQ